MKKVYISTFEMFDGEERIEDTEIFENLQDAQDEMQELIENYEEFWHDFDTIEKDEWNFSAFNMGWHDNAYMEISIEEKEIK